ncbi:hypothetical protein DM992_37945 [Burkholderia sp. JP2-270]|nr:hypothetical protein DM992_37945 [Burkholderia sp. JP2-270]
MKHLGSYRYHRHHALQARSVLKAIEERHGKTNPAHIKLADAYARDVLGHARYAPWLYVYSAVSGGFKEGWIPDNYYGSVVVPAIKGGYGKISDLRSLQSTLFHSAAFPDLAYFVNGLFLTPDNATIAPTSVKRLLFAERDEIVFKVDNSLQGRGCFFFRRDSFDLDKIEALGNGVFQERIVQHEALSRFVPGSVATLRMTTAIDDKGHIALRACYLRLGRAADTHVQSNSHVRVAVDLSTGELAREGYMTNWLTVPTHPDTRVAFSGNQIPAFVKCVATVLGHHRKMPLPRSVGWDVAIGRDETVKLMEWNAMHNDIKFSEATQGPCFNDLGWDRIAHRNDARTR